MSAALNPLEFNPAAPVSAISKPAEDQPGFVPYYHNDFMAVIAGVRQRYAEHLNADEQAYLAMLDALSPPARMLYARLVNRRGRYFRQDRLAYAEIRDLETAIEELGCAGLLKRVLDEDAPVQLLGCFTYPELKLSLQEHRPVRTCRRQELLDWLANWDGYAAWLRNLLARYAIIGLPASDPFAFLRFLFFGELRENLSDFVIKALGHVVTETVDPAALRPLFVSRQEMDDAYRMAILYSEFRDLRQKLPAGAILMWWKDQAIFRDALTAGMEWFDRLVDRLGRLLERAGELAEAAALYATSPIAPARERLARLLIKSGDTANAMVVLREMLAAPSHAEEAYAARQLLARLERRARRSEARDLEITCETLKLDYEHGCVEQAVLDHYREQGWHGVHSENWLWNASFGLLLWDIVYDPKLGVFHSPFQFAPSDLHHADFYERRRPRIEARLSMLAEPAAAFAIMREHFQSRKGVANPFVAWHDGLLEILQVMAHRLPAAGHAVALRHLGQNISRHSSGLPDLFLWNDRDYRFVEIKAENDHLSGHQFEWLRLLKNSGINVSLEKVQRISTQCTGL